MISIHVFILILILAASVIFGFFGGMLWMSGDRTESGDGDTVKVREKHGEKKGKSWSVGSPVSGQAAVLQEGPGAEIVIQPAENKLYAPAGGKITKLYPLGNAFRFHTEFGAELYIQAGDIQDELLGRYYRPRIVQNEIVSKGKLLLEFDREGLEAEGASPEVSVRVDSCVYGSDIVTLTEGQIKTGEEILRMQEILSERAKNRRGVQSASD